MFSTLDEIADGTRFVVDSNIFIYHFTGASAACRHLLERCESGRVAGVTSTFVVAEVTHRLMTIEAVAKGLVSAGDVARKLREKPEIIKELDAYQQQVELIPRMGILVLDLDPRTLTAAAGLRRRYGLLTNDSLLVATAVLDGVTALASADRDFERVDALRLFCPQDL